MICHYFKYMWGSGGSPGEENGNPLQYSGLENPHGQRSLAGYSPWGRQESDVTEQLSTAQHLSRNLSSSSTGNTEEKFETRIMFSSSQVNHFSVMFHFLPGYI